MTRRTQAWLIASLAGALGCLTIAAPALAWDSAQASDKVKKDQAVALSQRGRELYKTGHYLEAIAEFEKAAELHAFPMLLYNLAHTYRKVGPPERAIYYYNLYLIRSPNARDRDDVVAKIAELNQLAASAAARRAAGQAAQAPPPAVATEAPRPAEAPPYNQPPPAPPAALPIVAAALPTNVEAEPEGEEAETVEEFDPERLVTTRTGPPPKPRYFRLVAHTGFALPHFAGANQLRGSAFFTGTVQGAFAQPVGFGAVDFGLAASWSPFQASPARLSHLVGGYANVTLRFALGPRAAIGPAFGFGVLWWTRLPADFASTASSSPVPSDMKMATAMAATKAQTIPMPTGRIGLPLTYLVGKTLFGVEPAFSFSKTTGETLPAAVSSFSYLAINAVIGWQL